MKNRQHFNEKRQNSMKILSNESLKMKNSDSFFIYGHDINNMYLIMIMYIKGGFIVNKSKDDQIEKLTKRLSQQEEILVQLLAIIASTNRKVDAISEQSVSKEFSYLN